MMLEFCPTVTDIFRQNLFLMNLKELFNRD